MVDVRVSDKTPVSMGTRPNRTRPRRHVVQGPTPNYADFRRRNARTAEILRRPNEKKNDVNTNRSTRNSTGTREESSRTSTGGSGSALHRSPPHIRTKTRHATPSATTPGSPPEQTQAQGLIRTRKRRQTQENQQPHDKHRKPGFHQTSNSAKPKPRPDRALAREYRAGWGFVAPPALKFLKRVDFWRLLRFWC